MRPLYGAATSASYMPDCRGYTPASLFDGAKSPLCKFLRQNADFHIVQILCLPGLVIRLTYCYCSFSYEEKRALAKAIQAKMAFEFGTPAEGSTGRPRLSTWKCRCGSSDRQELPVHPSTSPAETRSPLRTVTLPRCRWQYWVVQPPPWSRRMPLPYSLPARVGVPHRAVLHPVVPSQYDAVGYRDDRQPHARIDGGDIRSFVPLIGVQPAAIVSVGRTGIKVHIAEEPAIPPDLPTHWEKQVGR